MSNLKNKVKSVRFKLFATMCIVITIIVLCLIAANVTKSLSGGKDISQTINASATMDEEPVNDSVANEANQFAQ